MLRLTKIWMSAADFFLPRICPSCGAFLTLDEKNICPSCISKLKEVPPNLISYEFQRSFQGSSLSGFFSLYLFEKDKELQHIIHSIKYQGRFQNAAWLGSRLGDSLRPLLPLWNIHLIIPVPLHHVKKAERGFNQSCYIAEAVSAKTGIPFSSKICSRRRYTDSQTGMSRSSRDLNVKDAFKIKREDAVKRKNILLIDDVVTTGATIRELAKTLHRSGAAAIYAASAALASH